WARWRRLLTVRSRVPRDHAIWLRRSEGRQDASGRSFPGSPLGRRPRAARSSRARVVPGVWTVPPPTIPWFRLLDQWSTDTRKILNVHRATDCLHRRPPQPWAEQLVPARALPPEAPRVVVGVDTVAGART